MRTSHLLLGSLTLSVLSGCVRYITEGEGVLQILRGVVYGTVLSESGTGLFGVRLELRPDPNGACPAQQEHSPNVATIETVTDMSGTFRASVALDVAPGASLETTCVRIDITPPVSVGARDTSVSVGPVRFTRSVTDSVRADVVLQWSPDG